MAGKTSLARYSYLSLAIAGIVIAIYDASTYVGHNWSSCTIDNTILVVRRGRRLGKCSPHLNCRLVHPVLDNGCCMVSTCINCKFIGINGSFRVHSVLF